jgi:hypothetical protein
MHFGEFRGAGFVAPRCPGMAGLPMSMKMHCSAGLRALERVEFITGRRDIMARILLIIVPLVLMNTLASAQQQPGHDACARDVARHCRAVMSDGDQAVLACLKEHRARLSKPCEKVLTEHGQ